MADATDALAAIFADPSCPSSVRSQRDHALANHHLDLAFHAFAQESTELGQKHIRAPAQLHPAFTAGQPSNLWYYLLRLAINDDSLKPEEFFLSILRQLPQELAFSSAIQDRGVAEGYWIKGCRAILWDRLAEGADYLRIAAALKATVYDHSFRWLVGQTHNIGFEFKRETADRKLEALIARFDMLQERRWSRRLTAQRAFEKAFETYRDEYPRQVPAEVFTAIWNVPSLATNRGLLAILARSVLGTRRVSWWP